ncbi:MAG: ATP-binding cassette domain-containing protein [Deinococcus-Thermus bacterium]|nr:ATP-binding cassette domain-containing protein [Deinococcota bacterium]
MTASTPSSAPQRASRTEPLFACRGLTKRFGRTLAVDDVGFHVAPGEAYGLLGPNGAGKTTTISMSCGLLEADAGEVTLDGVRLADAPTRVKAGIGYVPQEIALYPDLSARENLTFFGRLYGMGGVELRARVGEVLELVELEDRADERLDTYSGGMKRRINIAAGLLHRPKLLVLDEPTVGVDPQSRNAILERVAQLNREGMALLYTSHYMEEVERLCDRIGIMDGGRMIAEGSRRELVDRVGQADRIELDVERDAERLAEACRRLDAVTQAQTTDRQVVLLAADGRALLPALLEVAERDGVAVKGVQVIEPDLEAVFLHLTGKALRD